MLKKYSEEWSRKYPGKYIAVVDGKIFAAETSPLAAYSKARDKAGNKEISIFYMPTDEEMAIFISADFESPVHSARQENAVAYK